MSEPIHDMTGARWEALPSGAMVLNAPFHSENGAVVTRSGCEFVLTLSDGSTHRLGRRATFASLESALADVVFAKEARAIRARVDMLTAEIRSVR